MKHTLALAATCVAIAVLVASGCSGPGTGAGSVRNDALRTIAVNHLSAVLQVQTWYPILYWISDGSTSVGRLKLSQEGDWHYEFLPDGRTHAWGTLPNGNEADYWWDPDGAGHGTEIRASDRAAATIVWTAATYDGDVGTQHLTETLFDGQEMDFDTRVKSATLWQQWDGNATLPDGRSTHFNLDRIQGARDILTLALPDGSRVELQVPVTWREGAVVWPIFTAGADGRFTDPSGKQQTIRLLGSAERWDRWSFECGDVRGEFTLQMGTPDDDLDGLQGFAGSGQLSQDGSVAAALRWDSDGNAVLEPVGAASADVLPSAASRDFQVDDWLADSARMIGLPF